MNTNRLYRVGERAAADPFFLGHSLHHASKERGWTDDQLAAFLRLDRALLPRLLRCGLPRADR